MLPLTRNTASKILSNIKYKIFNNLYIQNSTFISNSSIALMDKTIPKYMENTYLFENDAKVVKILPKDNNIYVVLTENTIFYPTGGGQPCDKGTMTINDIIFTVTDVVHSHENRELIEHHGNFNTNTPFNEGDIVHQKIDENYRRTLARLHSGGHLLDQAMFAAGYDFPSTKGNHRVGESSVEYSAKLEAKDRDVLLHKVQDKLNELIQQSIPTEIKHKKASELLLTGNLFKPEDEVRVVCVGGECNYPCSGTHVNNTNEIGKMKLTKAICKKGQLKISYSLED